MKQILRKAKRFALSLRGEDFFERPDARYRHERLGSAYGGWDLVTGHLNDLSIVYSFGLGEDATFDIALIERFNMTVHVFDPTPKSIAWARSQNFSPKFELHEYGLADFDGEISFNPPENPDHVSHTILDRPATHTRAISVPVKRIYTIMNELGHDHIDLLKMDIEGAEYRVIDDVLNSKVRPKQILVEFHHRFLNVGINKSKSAIAKIRAAGYKLFSVSSTGEEYSFMLNGA